ncbi:hypothetical protein [Phytopseudomonas seleniipraecipitans]|uniref:5-bromo-4-chloroindolyl phosphate hydrolysis protein n=1 Tax=Phytopseudomonas seleniipraecipitans TaxID=640205 RepID=A0A1G7JEY2_9GAMM|nr:hypothetical protein [Pseudomonas seleniipraecipitans]SDF23478.1 hypothetical protein SAMN05216381_1098 [Pseudomonas seleniipraecipitans]
MSWFPVSHSMKVASVWGIWAFIAIGSLGWALFVVLAHFDALDNAHGWVQAVGSILALIVAIVVPYRLRIDDAMTRDYAHGMRLYTVIWEALEITEQLLRQEREHQAARLQREMVQEVIGHRIEIALSRSRQVLQRDVDFYQRIFQRAATNLDDDLSDQRHKIAAKFRFNLSVLISSLSVRVNGTPDAGLLRILESAHENFGSDLVKLVGVSPQLEGAMG